MDFYYLVELLWAYFCSGLSRQITHIPTVITQPITFIPIKEVIVLSDRWYNSVLYPWINMLKSKDVHEFFSLLIPATISLGLRQIASFTDLCFASLVSGAAAGLSCDRYLFR